MTSRNRREKHGPDRPENWRDFVNTDYEYPSDFDDLSRRERRRAKKDWRREDQGQRMAWLRDQRRSEPVSPVSVLVLVVLLVVAVVGLGGGLPKILGGGGQAEQPIGLLTPEDRLPLPTDGQTSGTGPPSSAPSAAETTPPPVTVTPNPAATLAANDIIDQWAKQFYTRSPATRTYSDFVNDAARYMTEDLAASFTAQGDSTYEALKAQGGVSKVVSVKISAPKPGTAPADTNGRISRVVRIVIDVTGANPAQITLPLLITLLMQGNAWVLSDVDGGTGP